MTDAELKGYHTIITDCWLFFKKFSDPLPEDKFWIDLMKEAGSVYTKHGKTDFSAKILIEVIREIENIHKQKLETQKKLNPDVMQLRMI